MEKQDVVLEVPIFQPLKVGANSRFLQNVNNIITQYLRGFSKATKESHRENFRKSAYL